MFARIQIYCAGDCCFDDIQKSNKPTVIINTEHIICVDERTCMFRDNYREYPYRLVKMSTGLKFFCVLESANELVELITQDHGTVPTEWSEEDDQYLLVCKNALAKYQVSDKWDATIISRWLEDKLKALKNRVQPQNRWKPSDEQMKCISDVVADAKYKNDISTNGYEPYTHLYTLLRQLKKLKEE